MAMRRCPSHIAGCPIGPRLDVGPQDRRRCEGDGHVHGRDRPAHRVSLWARLESPGGYSRRRTWVGAGTLLLVGQRRGEVRGVPPRLGGVVPSRGLAGPLQASDQATHALAAGAQGAVRRGSGGGGGGQRIDEQDEGEEEEGGDETLGAPHRSLVRVSCAMEMELCSCFSPTHCAFDPSTRSTARSLGTVPCMGRRRRAGFMSAYIL